MKKFRPSNTISDTGYYSKCLRGISSGCRLCVKGRKLVLFVTGLCSRRCYYCPLSDQKKNKDVIFANERPVHSDKDLLIEAKISGARGASITGGDPLAVLGRTIHYIKILKKAFGKKFHIHLYAPPELITEKKLERLYKAGLDEIRFHPNLNNEKNWKNIEPAFKMGWDAGIEIPAIPGLEEENKKLINYVNGKIKFLNINELEISDTNANRLLEKGFVPKDRISYGVLGSERTAMRIMRYCRNMPFSVHYCTAKLKDAVQLANRIKLRAENAAEKFDIIMEEGLLLRGAIYLPELKPSFSYKKEISKISKARKAAALKQLQRVRKELILKYRIPENLIKIDPEKLRIVTALPIVEQIADDIKKEGLIAASVRQYPTFDQMEVELKFL